MGKLGLSAYWQLLINSVWGRHTSDGSQESTCAGFKCALRVGSTQAWRSSRQSEQARQVWGNKLGVKSDGKIHRPGKGTP